MSQDAVVNKPVLNSLERTTLRNCEKTITKGVETFREVGEALAQIRDQQLFRESYGSFKAYCKEKWGFSDSRARQLMGGAEVANEVESVTRVTLSNEKQARILSKLPKQEQKSAWVEAVDLANGNTPTKEQLEAVVEMRIEKIGEDADSAGTPEESDSRPSRNDTETPAVDFGKCPACAGTKWTEDEDGVSCAKCHHPYGEPAGDTDEERLKTQRQKTIKTIEALMRAFDDLQTMLAKPEHVQAIRTCKALLTVAKGWK